MRDENERHATLALFGKEEVGDLSAGLGVEVTRRLVGDQELRRGRERPGDRHALLFAAGSCPG